jgi:protein SCO1/2
MRFHKVGLLMLLVAATACSRADSREYTLQGQIIAIAPDRTHADVKHEEIKGFMAAMTMPYKVEDAKELEGLKPGDLFTSTLVVVSNDAFLKDVKKVGEAPLETGSPSSSSAPASAPSASSGFELLKPGEQLPEVPLVDQEGRPRSVASLKGSTVVLTFIYTQCPLPTFCPLMDRHFVTLQKHIHSDPALSRVQLATVSFDPVTDTPPVLKRHAERLGADPTRWTFFTGNRDDVDRFASRFGVSIARDLSDPKNITHNLRTAIIDPEGRLVKSYTGNEWTPEQILADLK